MKTIKIKDETWKKLMQFKIEGKKKSVDETIDMILKTVETVKIEDMI